MAPQLACTAYFDLKVLKEGFETKLIGSKASCSMRAVQRIRSSSMSKCPPQEQTESPLREALLDKLSEQSYLYRCEMASSILDFVKGYRKDQSVGFCGQLAIQEQQSIASYNNGMATFEVSIYTGYRSTSLITFYLSMSLAAMEGLDTGLWDGLRRGLPNLDKNT
jgi:hypothetical protein